jgi:hypothetical protein
MKFKITFKDPDGPFQGLTDAANFYATNLGLPPEEHTLILEHKYEEFVDFISKWVEYGEYITIEFDTEEGTAKVIPL